MHDYFVHVAARLEELHSAVERGKAGFMAQRQAAGDMTDPFAVGDASLGEGRQLGGDLRGRMADPFTLGAFVVVLRGKAAQQAVALPSMRLMHRLFCSLQESRRLEALTAGSSGAGGSKGAMVLPPASAGHHHQLHVPHHNAAHPHIMHAGTPHGPGASPSPGGCCEFTVPGRDLWGGAAALEREERECMHGSQTPQSVLCAGSLGCTISLLSYWNTGAFGTPLPGMDPNQAGFGMAATADRKTSTSKGRRK